MNNGNIGEIVAHFGDQDSFKAAVDGLLAAGFAREDLSVLGSHDSLEITEAAKSPLGSLIGSLVGEVKYAGPLTTAGFIALASGPTGFFIAGLVAAGVFGVATKELLDDMTAVEHAEAFAHAFDTGGVILWVRVAGEADGETAKTVLAAHGGDRIHYHQRGTNDDG